jgi:hypothetical protein
VCRGLPGLLATVRLGDATKIVTGVLRDRSPGFCCQDPANGPSRVDLIRPATASAHRGERVLALPGGRKGWLLAALIPKTRRGPGASALAVKQKGPPKRASDFSITPDMVVTGRNEATLSPSINRILAKNRSEPEEESFSLRSRTTDQPLSYPTARSDRRRGRLPAGRSTEAQHALSPGGLRQR